jgi:hypothetical protein
VDESPAAHGIYDAFPGHRLPGDAELDDALRTALVVVDANVLLNLYRYNESTRTDLLGVLRRLEDRLWAPHQVLTEFWRNRLRVLGNSRASTKEALEQLGKQRRSVENTLRQWAKSTAVDTAILDGLVGNAARFHDDLEAQVQRHAPVVADTAPAGAEPVLVELEELLAGRVGPPPAPEKRELAIVEGNRRAEAKQPPGYLDAGKLEGGPPEGAAGDYLVWSQAVAEAGRRGQDLLLVTGDEKEDWWWRDQGRFLGPRIELVVEFAATTGRRLYLMRPVDLLRRAPALAVTVRDDSVHEAERVGELAEASWTREGLTALLERLEGEGWPHAEIIREAARSGGSISRDRVYEISGYTPERMLKGFTRPAGRITGDLRGEGVVDPGVESVLTPIYDGPRAVGFAVPPELVGLLAGPAGSVG